MQAQIEWTRDQLKHISDPSNYMPMTNAGQSTTPLNQSNTITTPVSVYSCSLFDDNYLYPQLEYRVDLSKISVAINDLTVQIGRQTCDETTGSEARGQPSAGSSMARFDMDLNAGLVLDALVSTGVLYDGLFWLQPAGRSSNEHELIENVHKLKRVQQRVSIYLDEVSKHVRRKRIGDDTWNTYAELGLIPQCNIPFFFL